MLIEAGFNSFFIRLFYSCNKTIITLYKKQNL